MPTPAGEQYPDLISLDTSYNLSAFGSEVADAPAPDTEFPAAPVHLEPSRQDMPAGSQEWAEASFPDAQDESPAAAQDELARPVEHSSLAADRRAGGGLWRRAMATALVVAVVLMTGLSWLSGRGTTPAAETGRLHVASSPAGARVVVDGRDAGTTPLTLALAPREYRLEVSAGTRTQRFVASVSAGLESSHHVHLASGAPPNRKGQSRSGERAASDRGAPSERAGTAPVSPRRRQPTAPTGSKSRGSETSSTPTPQPAVTTPTQPASDPTEARPQRDAPRPTGTLSLNALPWAEVYIDGAPAGDRAEIRALVEQARPAA